jgi:homoserine dehydrogenase
VALLGLGTVGAEVARALLERADELAGAAGGRRIELVAVGVRDPERARAVDLPDAVERTDDLDALAAHPDIVVLVELLGGREPSAELVTRALDDGRAVVTANKALLAFEGERLERLARERSAPLRFEAAVAAGLPILAPLARDLAANRWTRVRGIVNGSTNLLLSQMAVTSRPLEACLADAQEHGLLEADPSADLEGHDAAQKLAILIRMAFGTWPDVMAIRRSPPQTDGRDGPPGILGVDGPLLDVAAREHLRIRLIASADRQADGRIAAFVAPAAVPATQPLAQADGLDNRIELTGAPLPRFAVSGPGAGGPSTSSAVLADLLAIARGEGSTWAGLPPAGSLPRAMLIDGLDGTRRWVEEPLDGHVRIPILDEA